MSNELPFIGVSANVRDPDGDGFHGARQSILQAVRHGAQCVPFIIPSLAVIDDIPAIAERLDGIVLTGGASNIDPALYGSSATMPADKYDRQRDATILPLIKYALKAGIPLLMICRGMQELNVALGGTMRVLPDDIIALHRDTPLDKLAHEILLVPESQLADLLQADTAQVNSSHSQAIDAVALDLNVDAMTADGVVEAVSVDEAPGFAIGVEWHPEYNYEKDPVSQKLFDAFGQAARQRFAQRSAPNTLG